MQKVQSLVIGAGVIGLAIAKKQANAGKKTLVLEANATVGAETSFRNSAVIHAGIYYSTDTLKAKLCAVGREQLYQYCRDYHVPYKKIGKLIVATNNNQLTALQKLFLQAQNNGVNDVLLLDKGEINKLEPQVNACAALYSPSTGTVHGKALLDAYQRELVASGGEVLCQAKVIQVDVLADGFKVKIHPTQEVIYTEQLINAAGLWAQSVSSVITGLPANTIPPIYYAKGNYFKYIGKKQPFSHLVYPMPEQAGLGVHATIDVFDAVRFGPDVEWVSALDFSINTSKKIDFYRAIKSYFPAIELDDLQAEFAGIRPKSKAPEHQPQDFDIQSEKVHGVKNLVNLYGMESPGLTCSLAIADYVHQLL